MVGNFSID